jgi:hypothetical protein
VVHAGLVMGCPLVARVACMSCLLSIAWWGHGAGRARQCTGTVDMHGVHRELQAAPLVWLRTWCGPCRAGDGLSPGGTGSLHVLPAAHNVAQGRHGAGTALHRYCGHTWRMERVRRPAATLVQLRTWCDGLSPAGPGSLDILLAVHGAVGPGVVWYACRMVSVRREVE